MLGSSPSSDIPPRCCQLQAASLRLLGSPWGPWATEDCSLSPPCTAGTGHKNRATQSYHKHQHGSQYTGQLLAGHLQLLYIYYLRHKINWKLNQTRKVTALDITLKHLAVQLLLQLQCSNFFGLHSALRYDSSFIPHFSSLLQSPHTGQADQQQASANRIAFVKSEEISSDISPAYLDVKTFFRCSEKKSCSDACLRVWKTSHQPRCHTLCLQHTWVNSTFLKKKSIPSREIRVLDWAISCSRTWVGFFLSFFFLNKFCS